MNQAERNVRSAAQNARPWVERLARLGYASKGLVYVVIGGLAFEAAISGGASEGSKGAFRKIVTEPFGEALLAIIGVGLIGYAGWRAVQCVLDPDGHGRDAKGLIKRIAAGASCVIHLGLAAAAFQLVFGGGSGSEGKTPQDWTATLMSQPFGLWLVGLLGAVVIAAGVVQIRRAYTADFQRRLRKPDMTQTAQTWAVRSGRLGLAARGLVFGIIGGFLIQAALRSDPKEAGGLAEALNTLARQPYGPWLLGAVAIGLIAYGIYSEVQALYRRIYV